MAEQYTTIWDSNINMDEWQDYLEEEAENRGVNLDDVSIDEKYNWIYNMNSDYLDDERSNLNIQLDNPIIAIGDIGRWNGRVIGYKIIESGNIKDILSSECEFVKWYMEDGDIKCTESHHDGTNYILYREVKDGVDIEELKLLIYNSTKMPMEAIDKYTISIADKVAKVYGWEI